MKAPGTVTLARHGGGFPARVGASERQDARPGPESSGIGVAFSHSVWLLLWVLLAAHGSDPVWMDSAGRLTPDGREALALLASASADGLDPAQYETAALQEAALRAAREGSSRDGIAGFNAALDSSLLRYFQHLHAGRVDPRSVGFRVAPHRNEDLAARVRDAAAEHRLPALAKAVTPTIPIYRDLRASLAKYRTLAADPALAGLALPRTTLHEGDRYAELPRLRRLLEAFGDLPVLEAVDPTVLDARLVDGVRSFQRRHGLEPDGVIGAATRAALAVPLSWRVRQIELAMERLRWLPERETDRLIAVNIPMFRLMAIVGSAPTFDTNVIVGRALNTHTPVMLDSLEQVIFRPYWNVPPSILRNEILPALRRDPGYLRKHNMEFVREGASLRVRQRPGPTNSLGLIKFAFPNDANVYMHDTPAPALFGKARRDLSHGCIRVADPVGLAEWVLSREDGWTRERIVAAMDAPESSTVTLARPIPVVLFYLTAVVLSRDGLLHFAEDIYGHDAALHRALETLCGSKTS